MDIDELLDRIESELGGVVPLPDETRAEAVIRTVRDLKVQLDFLRGVIRRHGDRLDDV